MKRCYVEKNFRNATLDIIDQANKIVTEYQAQGFNLTLRQVYYQFVSRGYLANKQANYNRLGSIVNDARLAGMIDWSAIEDRTRFLRALAHWDSPDEIVDSAVHSYRRDKWENQPVHPEVWIEKDALIDIVAQACKPMDVPHFSCRGYISQTAMYNAAQRLRGYNRSIIFHFGDHDPSGIDMTRDIQDRLNIFGVYPDVIRVALNMDQVEEHNPPPNPAKETDSRFKSYIAEYGDESWELDALEPALLKELISEHLVEERDDELWDEACEQEEQERSMLREAADDIRGKLNV